MKVGTFFSNFLVKIKSASTTTTYKVDIIVRESSLFWYVGEREIKFSKNKLLSVGSTKWTYDKIEEISKEEYDLFLEKKQKKENFYNFKSNILKSIQNDYFFINISYEDLSKLNSFIEELKVKK